MITLEANYSKKIGLPQYSSHQFSITLKSELADVSQVEKESARLYDILQNSVDSNIQQVGFLPGERKSNGNGHSSPTNGNGLRGITKVALSADSFLAGAGFQSTAQILAEAALTGMRQKSVSRRLRPHILVPIRRPCDDGSVSGFGKSRSGARRLPLVCI